MEQLCAPFCCVKLDLLIHFFFLKIFIDTLEFRNTPSNLTINDPIDGQRSPAWHKKLNSHGISAYRHLSRSHWTSSVSASLFLSLSSRRPFLCPHSLRRLSHLSLSPAERASRYLQLFDPGSMFF